MKTMVKDFIMASALCLALAACSTWDKLDNTERGAVIGTGSGAVVGSAVGGTTGAVVGGIGGGVAGGLIGDEMDERERHRRR